MKKIIVSTIASAALIAPLAVAKDQNTKKNWVRPWHFAFITEKPVTITAPSSRAQVVGGAAAGYQPANTFVVQHDGLGRYVLDEPGRVFNRKGQLVAGRIRPGTPVRVYFAADDAGNKTIDRVIVD